jgi:hypothetical protein
MRLSSSLALSLLGAGYSVGTCISVEEVATGMLSPDLKTRMVEVQASNAAPPEPKR